MSLRTPLGATNKQKSLEKCVIERPRRRGRGGGGGGNVENVWVFIVFSRMQVFTFSGQVAKHDGGVPMFRTVWSWGGALNGNPSQGLGAKC